MTESYYPRHSGEGMQEMVRTIKMVQATLDRYEVRKP